MTELLTAAQMRAIEEAAMASGAVTGLELMERAGQGVVEAIFAQWPELGPVRESGGQPGAMGRSDTWRDSKATPGSISEQKKVARRAVVLCGPGNNGGDGFVVARLLVGQGWDVDVFLYGDAAKLPPDAKVNYDRWSALGDVAPLSSIWEHARVSPDLIVDAIFGTGLSRPMSVELAGLHKFCAAWPMARTVAVDGISGVDLDSGRILVEDPKTFFAQSNLTVTFHAEKLGHRLGETAWDTDAVKVVDLGIAEFDEDDGTKVALLEGDFGQASFAKDFPVRGGHKFNHGHALILSGGVGRGGAARLAARGALRVGAGVVTVGCPAAALMENAIALDAVMVRRMEDDAALAEVLEDTRINALCLGPGFGVGPREVALVRAALESGRALALDADALTVLAGAPEVFALLHEKCVLTPHAGEFGRLFPDLAEKLGAPAVKGPAYSKVDAAREAANRAGCVVLFKGPDTVIAGPNGRCSVNAALYERAVPWLATAGAGDVLAGFITGMMARGFAPMQAAELGAWLHVECARAFGPGLIAEDLPEQVPAVLRELGL